MGGGGARGKKTKEVKGGELVEFWGSQVVADSGQVFSKSVLRPPHPAVLLWSVLLLQH